MKQGTIYFLVVGLFLFSTITVFGQVTGDYRTNGNVTMTSAVNWQVYRSTFPAGWYPAGNPPIAGLAGHNQVEIRGGNICTYDAGGGVQWGNLLVNGGTLNFNVVSTASLEVLGDVDNNTGTIRNFSPSNFEFIIRSDLVNHGTFDVHTGAKYGRVTMVNGAIAGNSCIFKELRIDIGTGVTLFANQTVWDNLEIRSLFNDGGYILDLKGYLGNTNTHTGSGKIMMSGSGSQNISGNGQFGNLEINKTTGSVNSSGNPVVNGHLTLSRGIISTVSNTFTIGQTGSVLRTNGHIHGNLRKYIHTGSTAVSFEVGDAARYAPVEVEFENVTAPGYLTVKSTAGDHAVVSTSGVNPSQSVNRYWSMTNGGVLFDDYSAIFTFNNPSDMDAGASPDSFVVKKYSDPDWSSATVGMRTSTTTEVIGLTSFSDFQIGEQQTYTISATASPYGTIDPAGEVYVNYGDDTTYVMTPDEGCHIDSITVDGNNVGAVPSYTFTDVIADHTIHADFSVNTHLVSIRAFRDIDGNFSTDADRSPMIAVLKVYRGNNLLDSAFNSVLQTTVVGDTLYGIEGSPWETGNYGIIGHVKNSIPVADTSRTVSVSLAGSENGTVDFIIASRVYQQRFRTFLQEEIVSLDAKSKVPKAVKRSKPDKVEFELEVTDTITAPKIALHVEFGGAPLASTYTVNNITQIIPDQVVKKNGIVQTLGVHYVVTGAIDGKNKKLDYTFLSGLVKDDLISIHGFVKASKLIKASYWWLSLSTKNPKDPKYKVLATDPAFKLNQPRLPMPTYANIIDEVYADAGYYPTLSDSFVIGTPHSDNPKEFGWVYLKKPGDIQKSLRDKVGTHIAGPFLFSKFGDGKPFIKEQKKLPPSKQNNKLFAEIVALKLAIDASATGHTEDGGGLGELIYYNPADLLLDGKMVKEIADLASEAMTARIGDSTNYYDVIRQINEAFDGPIDTSQFVSKTILKGTNQLIDIPFLRVDPGTLIARVTSRGVNYSEIPMIFELRQNYPNPFNPSTAIQFTLPEEAIVTLRVYNMLGQVVGTLLDREPMSDGDQEVEYNAFGLSSGVYFYRIVAEGISYEEGISAQTFTQVKKMLFLK